LGGALKQRKTPNNLDGNFYKIRFVGIGNIGPDIKFGGLSLKNK